MRQISKNRQEVWEGKSVNCKLVQNIIHIYVYVFKSKLLFYFYNLISLGEESLKKKCYSRVSKLNQKL